MADAHLRARMSFDQTEFQSGLKEAEVSLNSFATKGLEKVKGALVAAFAAEGLIKLGEQVVELSSKFKKLSAETGINAEELQRLDHAAKKSSTTLDDLISGIIKMTVSMEKGLQGSQEMRDAFSSLGITLDDLKTLSPQQVFEKLSDAVAASNDPVKTAGALSEIFGKNFKELLPLLSKGSEEIGRLKAETKNIIPEEALQSVSRLKRILSEGGNFFLKGMAELIAFFERAVVLTEILLLKISKLRAPFTKDVAGTLQQIDKQINELAKTGEKKKGKTGLDDVLPNREVGQTAEEKAAATEEENRLKRVAELTKKIGDEKERMLFKQISAEDQLLVLQQKREAIEQDLDSGNSQERELELNLELLKVKEDVLDTEKKIQDELQKRAQEFGKEVQEKDDALRKIDEIKEGKNIKISAPITDSLSRIGGFVGGSANNNVRLAEKQFKVLEEIRDLQKKFLSKNDPYGGNNASAIFEP